jgi:hypothetical protein
MRSINLSVSKQKFNAAILLLACSTLALSGCSQTLDEAKVESSIKEGITSQAGLVVESVSCPKDVKIEADATFQCQAKTEKNDSFPVDVKQKDDKGNVAWNLSGLMPLAKVEQEIQQGVEKKLELKVTADCGGKVKVVRSGDTFECKVTDGEGKEHTAKITATNNDGGFKWEI